MIAALLSYGDANVANESANQTSLTSFNLVELVTGGILLITLIFTFAFWYAANRPNIIIRSDPSDNSATIVIANEGLRPARNLTVTSDSFKLSKDTDQSFNRFLPVMYPKEQLEYYVAPGYEAVRLPEYEFDLVHDRWIIRRIVPWWKETRHFTISFSQYADMLTSYNTPTRLEQDIRQIAQMGHILIKSQIDAIDRQRSATEQIESGTRQPLRLARAIRRVFKQDV